ncbi:C-GCAxxG-C-C family protein [Candidatus Woesearchaeota archaeon]|nr:C-GCAxxG-C-C family protein [Candidatus Woesearchaeota archaeon]
MSLAESAKKLYLEGYSCTEAVLHAMKQTGHPVTDEVLRSATGFRAGIGGSGCICGAISGATMAIGLHYGRSEKSEDSKKANDLSKHIYDKFEEKYSVTCCNLLTADYKFDSPERKNLCSEIVAYVAGELDKILPNS